MPEFGLRRAFIVLGAVLVLAAILPALLMRRPVSAAIGVAAACCFMGAALHNDEGWRYIISAGVFRENVPELWAAHVLNRTNHVHLDFYEANLANGVGLGRGQ